jgi:hypothetical protein
MGTTFSKFNDDDRHYEPRTTKKRIQLLVDGYTKRDIPVDICGIICDCLYLIDTWDIEYSHAHVIIFNNNPLQATLLFDTVTSEQTLYGTHKMKYKESFTYTLLLSRGTNVNFIVGLIPDRAELLLKQYQRYYGCAISASSGIFFDDSMIIDNTININNNNCALISPPLFNTKGDKLQIDFYWTNDNLLVFDVYGFHNNNVIRKTKIMNEMKWLPNQVFRLGVTCINRAYHQNSQPATIEFI